MTAEELAATQRKAGLAMIIASPAARVLGAARVLHGRQVAAADEAVGRDRRRCAGRAGGLILEGVCAGVWVATALCAAAGAGMVIAGLRDGKVAGMILGAALLITACPWFFRLALQMRRARRSDM